MAKKNNNNKAAGAAALLQKDYDDAVLAFNSLPVDASDNDKLEAQKVIDDAKKALEIVDGEVLLIEFIKSPTKKFALAYSVGEQAEFSTAQAAELIEAGFAEAVGSETEE
jgi:hypothetical protein